MAKTKKVFFCNSCGIESLKWAGKCDSCHEWNTIEEKTIEPSVQATSRTFEISEPSKIKKNEPRLLSDVDVQDVVRLSSGDGELDRVLGGGIVSGSIILISGSPGIGKSTLLLQSALKMNATVFYSSGEESAQQIKLRSKRIEHANSHLYVYDEQNIIKILTEAKKKTPDLLIIDSIQTLFHPSNSSTIGSVSQIKDCTSEIQRFAKAFGIPIIVVGHITKDGNIAGPKLMEHMVDVVLHFEGDKKFFYRLLRAKKNRFGSTDELGIYEMKSSGLHPLLNPSEALLAQHSSKASGSSVAVILEGQRPLLIETQALVTNVVYGNPQRSTTGYDQKRLNMILAILEKRCKLPFIQQDVFLNITGGLKVLDTGTDLSVVAALISSMEDISLPAEVCFAGEVGLSGEVRSVSKAELRIKEAERLGFDKIYLSQKDKEQFDRSNHEIQIIGVENINDLLKTLI